MLSNRQILDGLFFKKWTVNDYCNISKDKVYILPHLEKYKDKIYSKFI